MGREGRGAALALSISFELCSEYLCVFLCVQTPGGTILRAAHLDIEALTLDREVLCVCVCERERERELRERVRVCGVCVCMSLSLSLSLSLSFSVSECGCEFESVSMIAR